MRKHTIIPCPACKGTGQKFNTNTHEYEEKKCTACKGSKIYDSEKAVDGPLERKQGDLIVKKTLMLKSTSFSHFIKLCKNCGIILPTRSTALSMRCQLKKEGESLLKW